MTNYEHKEEESPLWEKMSVEYDLINKPKHYNIHPSGVECIQITEHMNFNLGNSIKYIWRAGIKDNKKTKEDLYKAKWYIDRELKRLGE